MKNVEIEFNLYVSDGSKTSFITDGKYIELDNFKRINFIEETEIKADTYVDIYKDKILLDRRGTIHMTMEYVENEITTVYMKTDFNYELSMNNFTKRLIIGEDFIDVIYQTETDKEENLTHNLVIKWK
jgi:uncharacterized beta-barrel protein YwiB (DUF1934 family)